MTGKAGRGFGGSSDSDQSADELIRDIRNSKRLPGVDAVRLPGEQSHAKRVENERDGIPIATPLLRILDQLADDLRVQRLL